MTSDSEKSRVRGLSFRLKLLIAILLIVAAISVSALLLTQNRVDAVYRTFLASQFEEQAELFFEKREARLSAIRDAISGALSNVRLIAALGAENYEQLYNDLVFELGGLLDADAYSDSGENRGQEFGPFFRFILPTGHVLRPSETAAGLVPGMREEELARALEAVGSGGDPGLRDMVGYLALGGEERPLSYEILLKPLFDEHDENRFLGDLVFGLPVVKMSDFASAASADRRHALWLSGYLFSDQIPEGQYTEVMKAVAGLTAGLPQESPEISLGGVSHRVFVRPLRESAKFPESYHISLFSLAELEDVLRHLRFTVYGFTGLALIVGAILSILVSHRMTKPILALVAGTEEIKKGNFGLQLPVRSGDEIGLLTGSFNSMSVDLALKERYRSVLDKVTDPDIAERLINGSVELGGELRDGSVLFCDIRGFTPLTEGMPPAEVIHMLNEHMTALTTVVNSHRGVVDKFVGDEIMVIFGAPRSYGEDTLKAARCALAMIREREKLNGRGKYSIQIGIGVASGEIVAGNMGSVDRLNYTVLGKQVNLASRLCSEAGPMEILVDANTRDRLRGLAVFVSRGKLSLKGFRSPVAAFGLHAMAPANDIASDGDVGSR